MIGILYKVLYWSDLKVKSLLKTQTLGVRAHIENASGEILLVKHTYIQGWHYPGGRVDSFEDSLDAVKREVLEESGIEVAELSLRGVYSNFSLGRNDHVIFYTGKALSDSPKPNRFEISEAKFFSRDELPQDISQSVLRRLSEEQGGW